VSRLKLDIPLNDKQKEMYNLLMGGRYSEVLFYGTSRSGKTFLILYFFVVCAVAFKCNCLVIRNTLTSLMMGMVNQTMPAVLNAIARYNGISRYENMTVKGSRFAFFDKKNNVLKFYNGAYIQFSSLRSTGDGGASVSYDKILSTEWGHIFADEVSEIDFSAIETLYSRLAQKTAINNMILFALNPTTELHWTYKRFFEHKTLDGNPIDDATVARMYKMHFSADDNRQFVSKGYFEGLSRLSTTQRARFLDGEYTRVGSGKYFRNFTWHTRPDIANMVDAVIYTDPSAKDSSTNDFKATVTLIRTRDARIWFWDCRAVQGTSYQMLQNIYELFRKCPIPPKVIIEKKQLPLDFNITLQRFQMEKGWTAPIIWDTMNHGDKFTCIESTLEPLVNYGKFVFCTELQKCGVYEQIVHQFVMFSNKKSTKDVKDDIPDACAKGVSFLNQGIVHASIDANSDVVFFKRGMLTSTKQILS
jgi:PBSX family phage terminase large subunit